METKSKIVYTVIGCMSGPNYSKDDAYILGIFPDLQTAVDCFEAEIDVIEPEEGTNFEGSRSMSVEDDTICELYEFTDFEEDCHGIIKVVKTELIERED
jgi:hypothetical protein